MLPMPSRLAIYAKRLGLIGQYAKVREKLTNVPLIRTDAAV
jgi:hypothetical protein